VRTKEATQIIENYRPRNGFYDLTEKPKTLTNLRLSRAVSFLYLATDIDMEYYIPLANVMWWQVSYKGEGE